MVATPASGSYWLSFMLGGSWLCSQQVVSAMAVVLVAGVEVAAQSRNAAVMSSSC
jgi:hypothetical protein